MTHAGAVDSSNDIHPSASIDPSARLGLNNTVGPGVIIGPRVSIGDGNTFHARCIVQQDTTIGHRNAFHPFAVIGGDPQDRAYNPNTPGELVIGDDNIFREYVSLHRATHPEPTTVIGSANYLMAGAHVGHNCQVGDRNTLANYASLSGHVRMGDGNTLSASTGVHQFCNVGDGCMFQFGAGVSTHAPPFCIYGIGMNRLVALNRVGLERNRNLTDADREEVRNVFRAVYRAKTLRPVLDVVNELLAEREWGKAADHFLTHIRDALTDPDPRRVKRGLCRIARHSNG